MTATALIDNADLCVSRRSHEAGTGTCSLVPTRGGFVAREWGTGSLGAVSGPGDPGRLGQSRPLANDLYCTISPGLRTPSSIARASSASLLAAVRPVAAYLARAR